MFQITAVTTNSLNFSWQDPTNPNGVITTYQLSCHPLLLGIPTPEHLSPGPTAQMAVLANLHSGVTYNCSILAENRAGQSNLVYAVGNTQETGVVHYCVLYISVIPYLPSVLAKARNRPATLYYQLCSRPSISRGARI